MDFRQSLYREKEVRGINSKTQLSEKDLHCIARMLQSALFADNIFYGCNFCNYKNECFTGNIFDMNDTNVRKKLQEITGVDLGPQFNRKSSPLHHWKH